MTPGGELTAGGRGNGRKARWVQKTGVEVGQREVSGASSPLEQQLVDGVN